MKVKDVKIKEIENWTKEDIERKVNEAIHEILQMHLKGKAKVISATSKEAEILLSGAVLIKIKKINSGYAFDIKPVISDDCFQVVIEAISVLKNPFWRGDK
ncbi:MAG: hypothetical protein ACP6IP_10475 [Candidatus Njordarchaeia archaeon]